MNGKKEESHKISEVQLHRHQSQVCVVNGHLKIFMSSPNVDSVVCECVIAQSYNAPWFRRVTSLLFIRK